MPFICLFVGSLSRTTAVRWFDLNPDPSSITFEFTVCLSSLCRCLTLCLSSLSPLMSISSVCLSSLSLCLTLVCHLFSHVYLICHVTFSLVEAEPPCTLLIGLLLHVRESDNTNCWRLALHTILLLIAVLSWLDSNDYVIKKEEKAPSHLSARSRHEHDTCIVIQ